MLLLIVQVEKYFREICITCVAIYRIWSEGQFKRGIHFEKQQLHNEYQQDKPKLIILKTSEMCLNRALQAIVTRKRQNLLNKGHARSVKLGQRKAQRFLPIADTAERIGTSCLLMQLRFYTRLYKTRAKCST